MLKQCKIMTCNTQQENCLACGAVRLKLGSVILFIMAVASATAFSQKPLGESVGIALVPFAPGAMTTGPQINYVSQTDSTV
ncbi:MAG TPA: hypothetical protein VFQ43_07205, partial [Nitrososphaera sp.]|nr:hypothetical protein [Nitrososphaera sp.]